MRTLYASKILRDKFNEATRSIVQKKVDYERPDKTNAYAYKKVSEKALRDILSKRRKTDFIANESVAFKGEPVDQSTHIRFRVKTGENVEDMMRSEIASLVGCPENRVKPRGAYWHPPGGYTEWTYKSSFNGWRIQVVYSSRPGESFFRWMENGEIITSVDTGFDIRMFHAADQDEFWSSVYSGKSHRVSVEFDVLKG